MSLADFANDRKVVAEEAAAAEESKYLHLDRPEHAKVALRAMVLALDGREAKLELEAALSSCSATDQVMITVVPLVSAHCRNALTAVAVDPDVSVVEVLEALQKQAAGDDQMAYELYLLKQRFLDPAGIARVCPHAVVAPSDASVASGTPGKKARRKRRPSNAHATPFKGKAGLGAAVTPVAK